MHRKPHRIIWLTDQTLPLALSIHSGPGTYALLLGSGVSRAAGIPTGWDITGEIWGCGTKGPLTYSIGGWGQVDTAY